MVLFLRELGRNQHLTNYLARPRPLLAQLSGFKRCIMTLIRPARSSVLRKMMAHTHPFYMHIFKPPFFTQTQHCFGRIKSCFFNFCKKTLLTITWSTDGKLLSSLSLAVPCNDHYHGRLHSQPTASTQTHELAVHMLCDLSENI